MHMSGWAVRDSNPHGFRHQILSLACLPISTTAREMPLFSGFPPRER